MNSYFFVSYKDEEWIFGFICSVFVAKNTIQRARVVQDSVLPLNMNEVPIGRNEQIQVTSQTWPNDALELQR